MTYRLLRSMFENILDSYKEHLVVGSIEYKKPIMVQRYECFIQEKCSK